MISDDINKFVDDTFTKVESTKLAALKTKQGWMEQLMAVVNLVPVAGGALAQELQVFQDYRNNEFFRKYTAYILGMAESSEKDRAKFAREVTKKAKDFSGNVIANLVDRLDNINKEEILANLTNARIEDKISIESFFRLSSVLERIPYVDFEKLIHYKEPFYDEDGDTELLASTGVLKAAKLSEEGNTYILSPLGQ